MIARARESPTALLEGLAEGVCVSDAEGKLLFMNAAAEALLGWNGAGDADNLCRGLCDRLAGPDSGGGAFSRTCPIRSAAPARSVVTCKGRLRCENHGVGRDIRVRCERIRTPAFDGRDTEKHFTLIEDVTPEAELERHREEWRNMATHDLRTPLTIVLGALRVLEEVPEGRALSASERNLLALAVRGARRMLQLVEDKLDYAKLEAGKAALRLGPVAVPELLRQCAEDQAPAAREKRIGITLDAAPGLSARADEGLLSRVVQNLLNNALKFTSAEGRVTIRARPDNGEAVLTLKDTGPGVAPESLPHLFDPYYQAAQRRAANAPGTGLGLAFCRLALKAMNGSIQVSSPPGQGCEFVVRLPSK